MSDPSEDVERISNLMADSEEHLRIAGEIQYPIEVAKVSPKARALPSLWGVGSWVAVRPVLDNPDQKTYLGVFLGDFPVPEPTIAYHVKTKELMVLMRANPAIYVPDLKKVVRGYESWWARLKTPEELKQITNRDIENVWYVRALREMTENISGTPTRP
jgi:hypothetical protein